MIRYITALILFGVVSIAFANECLAEDARPVSVEGESSENPVMVFAAAGTMLAMQPIADAYEKYAGREVIMNFASSSVLARQIESGADFDVYLSANPKWMSYVQGKGFVIPESRRDILTDRLAVIVPADSKRSCDNMSISELINSTDGYISIGDASHVPCGMYAKEALVKMNCWESIQSRIVPSPTVRSAQQYVETGQCDLGIVYNAGATQSDKVRIVALIGEGMHTPVTFSVACSKNSSLGDDFIHFLDNDIAINFFSQTGFSYVNPQNILSAQSASIESVPKVNVWQTLTTSIKVATTCTLVVAAPGIVLGYILARKNFPGKSLVNALVHLPMVIPPVVAGYMALVVLGKNSFVGGFLYDRFGISIAFSWFGAVLVSAIMGLPLLIRSVKTAVEMIDKRYSYAAGTLGASKLRTFFTITIPLAGPGILAGLVLAFARSLGEFGATVTFAGNIPGETQTLSLAIFNFTQIPGAESAVIRLVTISVLLSFAAMLGSELLNQKMKHLAGVR